MPLHGEGSLRDAFERRAEYFRLRRGGMTASQAWAQLGGLNSDTGKRWERWFQAIESGAVEEPVWDPGRKDMTETSAWYALHGGEVEKVTFRPRGHSMEPLIRDGQRVTIRRLGYAEPLERGDIVLARVGRHVYLHKVTAVDGGRVQIGNNHGHINGWTSRDNVAGKLVK